MMYDGILSKPQLDDLYLKHFNPNHDPKNGQFTNGNGGMTYKEKVNILGKRGPSGLINASVDQGLNEYREKNGYKISGIKKSEYDMSVKMDRGKGKSKIEISAGLDSGFEKNDFKEVSKDFFKNEESIEKAVRESISEDPYLYNIFGKPKGMSKNEFLDSLEIKGIHVVDKKWPVEISVWEKDSAPEDLIGWHSLDIEMDLKKPKKTGVAMNG